MRACYDDITASGGRVVDVDAFLSRVLALGEMSDSQETTARAELARGYVYIAPDGSWSLTPIPGKPRSVTEARTAYQRGELPGAYDAAQGVRDLT